MPAPAWLKTLTSPRPRTRRVVRAVVHYAVLVATLVGLWYLGRWYAFDRYLDSHLPGMHPFWLPLFFLLLYLLVRVGLVLYRSLGADRPTREFPDLDAAWAAVAEELGRSNLDLKAVPAYLVLGRPAGGVEALFAAARLPLLVRAYPTDPAAPLHVYAHPRAVFVACEGASLVACHVESLDAPGTAAAGPALPPPGRPSADAGTAHRLAARLRYVCRLIARDRDPYCPVNGLLWVVPAAGVDTEADAEELGLVCVRELMAARAALQLWCPSVYVISDLDRLDGIDALLKGLSAERRAGPLGVTFPLLPNADEAGRQLMLAQTAAWLCRAAIPTAVAGLLRVERPGELDQWQAAVDNAPPVLAARQATALELPLVRFLREATTTPVGEPPLTGGCYLVATGGEAHQHAFAAAPLDRLAELQSAVAWTADARAEEAASNRLAALGAVIVFAWLAVLALEVVRMWAG